MFCGVEDHLAALNDFRWLKDQLTDQDSLAFYEEYQFGHLSFMLPTNLRVYQDIVTLVKGFNPEFKPTTERCCEESTKKYNAKPILISDEKIAEG